MRELQKQGENKMAFLMMSSQKSLLSIKKNSLQFEYSCKVNSVQNLKKKEADYAKSKHDIESASGSNLEWDMENDPEYRAMVKQEENITIEVDNLNSQIQIVDAEIAAMKTMVQHDVKQATSLNLLGGG